MFVFRLASILKNDHSKITSTINCRKACAHEHLAINSMNITIEKFIAFTDYSFQVFNLSERSAF